MGTGGRLEVSPNTKRGKRSGLLLCGAIADVSLFSTRKRTISRFRNAFRPFSTTPPVKAQDRNWRNRTDAIHRSRETRPKETNLCGKYCAVPKYCVPCRPDKSLRGRRKCTTSGTETGEFAEPSGIVRLVSVDLRRCRAHIRSILPGRSLRFGAGSLGGVPPAGDDPFGWPADRRTGGRRQRLYRRNRRQSVSIFQDLAGQAPAGDAALQLWFERFARRWTGLVRCEGAGRHDGIRRAFVCVAAEPG